MLSKLTKNLNESIKLLKSEEAPLHVKILLNSLKIILTTVRDFIQDNCFVRASSLTYYTLLAILPFSAVTFAVLKHTGVQNIYAAPLLNKILLNPKVTEKVIEYINSTDVSALGIAGGFTLFLTSLVLINNIEKALNHIWNIKKKRHLLKKLLYYLSAILIFPIIITVGLSAALSLIKRIIPFGSNIIPYLITFTGFTLVYLYFPNTKVKFKSAFAGAAVTTIFWHIAQQGYIFWVKSSSKYNIIYGSFTQIVLVFIWIYISWLVVLGGAELSYAVQKNSQEP